MPRTAPPLLASVLLALAPAAPRADAAPAAPSQAPAGLRLSLATGGGTVVEIADAIIGGLGNALAGYGTEISGRRELVVRLDREVGARGRYGFSYAYVGWDERLTGGPTGSGGGTLVDRVHAVLGHAFVRWVDRGGVELTSGLGLGLARWSETGSVDGLREASSHTFLAWQLHAIGLGIGNDWLRIFGELGFGFEGVGVIGLAARF